jgi:tetratricopeptide (TPR) repeat protein
MLESKGDYAGAEPLYRRALEASERGLGSEHPDTLGKVNDLAFLLQRRGDDAGAETLHRRALEARERVLGPEHIDTFRSLHNLSMIVCGKGNSKEAIRMMDRVLGGYRHLLPADHPNILIAKQDLACYMERDGNTTTAETLFREALAGYEQKLGCDHPDTLRTVNNLAGLLDKIGKTEEARVLHLRYLKAQAANNYASPLVLRQLAGTFYRLGEYSEAELLLKRVIQNNFELSGNHCHLARVLILTGRDREAREEVAKAWEHHTEGPPYVVPRILLFQLLFATLGQDQSTLIDSQSTFVLGQLKTALQNDAAFAEWAMQPVLDHLRSRLRTQDLELLTTLVAALNDRTKLPNLERFPEWREARPQPLE